MSTELRELRLEVELRVSKGRETLRLEMKRTQDRELNTHEELQRSLVQRIAEKDVTIADKNAVIVDLRASLEREETSGSGHPRVEDSDRISGHTEAGKTVHYRRSRGVARTTMERTNGGSLKLGSMLSFCIGVTKKSCSNLSCT